MRNKQNFGLAISFILLCMTSSCSLIRFYSGPQGDGSGQSTPISARHAEEKYTEWCNFPGYIIPRICAYYQLHPERFKPIGHGEEIEIEGFAAFVQNDDYFKMGHRSSSWAGKLKDPWGDPVHFVQDLNMDGIIEAGGVRRPVWNEDVNGKVEFTNQDHHFGILKQSPFKVPYGIPEERIFAVTFHDARPQKAP
ncbi:hypothetical protein [Pedosphaera parvula]|uniref:Lipoprotein n=1 Tax=Pedosphaera parvula (strain Ellin514) TaxID=320771 RepID=B9XPC2_PEDPL|nr:hypothetical protein [Pedosphaera parvula]EEF58262.1 hypothetical protein Cflav_PD0990 [Pedosphaera parvula Ellin514]